MRQVSLCPRLRGWPWRRVSKVFGRWIRRLLGRGRGGLGALLSCAFRRLAGDRTARPVRPVLLLLHVDEMSTPRGRTTSCGRGRHTGHPRGCSHSLQTSGGCTHARALSLCAFLPLAVTSLAPWRHAAWSACGSSRRWCSCWRRAKSKQPRYPPRRHEPQTLTSACAVKGPRRTVARPIHRLISWCTRVPKLISPVPSQTVSRNPE